MYLCNTLSRLRIYRVFHPKYSNRPSRPMAQHEILQNYSRHVWTVDIKWTKGILRKSPKPQALDIYLTRRLRYLRHLARIGQGPSFKIHVRPEYTSRICPLSDANRGFAENLAPSQFPLTRGFMQPHECLKGCQKNEKDLNLGMQIFVIFSVSVLKCVLYICI